MSLLVAWLLVFLWERRATKSVEISALKWFRGAVFYAGFPYLLIAHVPILNVLVFGLLHGNRVSR